MIIWFSAVRGLRSNPVTRLFRDVHAGNVLAEYVVAWLASSALIVAWSFAFVSARCATAGSLTPAHVSTTFEASHPRLNVRAIDDALVQTRLPFREPRDPSKPETGTAASDPLRTVDVTPRRDGDLRHLRQVVARAAHRRGVPSHILAGLADDESSWRPHVVGKHGEVGLFQLKAGTAAWCGITDRRQADQNADCGARYLAAQFETFGTWELALVAFKAGPSLIPEHIPAASWDYARRALLKAEAYR